MHIVYVSDGKAGHRSQALGLYKAIQRIYLHEVTFQEVPIQQLSWWSLGCGRLTHQLKLLKSTPAYIVGVGSHTQSRVLALGKIYPKAKTIILMKANFPLSWFDHVIVPEHDGLPEQGNVLVTKGALNPILNQGLHQPNRVLIALGGSSKRHAWNESKVLAAIQQITQHNTDCEIVLTTSRRTPKEFLNRLKTQTYSQNLQIFPVEETPQGWIFEEMQKAQAVWVTEDSVSMMYEALTAGCQVGIIAIDRLKQDRITRSVDQLMAQALVSDRRQLLELAPSTALKEADRVATYLLAP